MKDIRLSMILVLCLSASLCSAKKQKKKLEKEPSRKLLLGAFDNGDYINGGSNILSDGGTKSSLQHLQMLVDQQKSLHNYKIVGHWLTDLDNKLDDVRDSISRRLADMGTSLQRRNSLGGHYAMMGGMYGGVSMGPSPIMRF